eukprot:Pgem_evm1s4948
MYIGKITLEVLDLKNKYNSIMEQAEYKLKNPFMQINALANRKDDTNLKETLCSVFFPLVPLRDLVILVKQENEKYDSILIKTSETTKKHKLQEEAIDYYVKLQLRKARLEAEYHANKPVTMDMKIAAIRHIRSINLMGYASKVEIESYVRRELMPPVQKMLMQLFGFTILDEIIELKNFVIKYLTQLIYHYGMTKMGNAQVFAKHFEKKRDKIVDDLKEKDCPISLESLSELKEVAITGCGHLFDQQSLEQVFQYKLECPVCRAKLYKPEPNRPRGYTDVKKMLRLIDSRKNRRDS